MNISYLFLFTHINRTTKTGGLPNITYVQHKPKPLETKFKCFVDSIMKIMLYIEVQEGKVRMSKKHILLIKVLPYHV